MCQLCRDQLQRKLTDLLKRPEHLERAALRAAQRIAPSDLDKAFEENAKRQRAKADGPSDL